MKTTIRLFALLAALCLLAGCASGAGQTETRQVNGETPAPTAPAAAEATPKNLETTPATVEATPEDIETTSAAESIPATTETASGGEPEGWEEAWPPEYPVENYRLSDGAIQQTGSLNKYRYEQLREAETYVELLADYVRVALDCGDALSVEEDSPHDGYANWFMEAPVGRASVSGSSITGRFTFDLYPGFDRILEMTEQPITDRAAMEQAARDFVSRFSGITGALELVKAADETQDYHDERSSGFQDVHVPAVVYTFRSAEHSRLLLELQEGLSAPVLCGDSTLDDLSGHCFTVTVWPDGTVVRGNNYITRAQAVPDGTVRMPDADDVPELISYLCSNVENDTVVIRGLRADSFSVYFGYADILPFLTMTYYFESDPEELLTTEFVITLLEDE